MKFNANDLINAPLTDAEGEKLGKIKDLLFDDLDWKIRYVVVDTGGWLKDRRVLVTPDHIPLTAEALENEKIPCILSKVTIEGCPPLDVAAPVSRRYEAEHAAYYRTSPYWLGGSATWGVGDSAGLVPPSPAEQAEHEQALEEIERCHVRSAKELEGYEVRSANDVELGEVEQFEVKWDTHQILTIVAKEGGLLSARQEREISPNTVREIDWRSKRIILSVNCVEDDAGNHAMTAIPAPGAGLPATSF